MVSNFTKRCDCRTSNTHSLDSNYLAESVVYQAIVETNNEKELYVGLTEGSFKAKYLLSITAVKERVLSQVHSNINYNITGRLSLSESLYTISNVEWSLLTSEANSPTAVTTL